MPVNITVPIPRRFVGYPVPAGTVTCPCCNEDRHPSLMPTPDKCAMCITYDEKFKGTDKPCLYDCFCCGKVYQVVQVNALAARPKCHQCREGLPPAATNDCVKCHNRFITYNQPEQDWVCGCCESGQEPWPTFLQRCARLSAYEWTCSRANSLIATTSATTCPAAWHRTTALPSPRNDSDFYTVCLSASGLSVMCDMSRRAKIRKKSLHREARWAT